jgi:phage RecT family recombinase
MSTTQPPRAGSRLNYDASSKAIQQAPQQSNALAIIGEHKAFLDARLNLLRDWAKNSVKPEALIRFTCRDMADERGEKLRQCTKESIYLGLIACAVTGLEPGALKGEAYLVPYRNKGVMEATFQRGYKGVIKMALRSRFVKSIRANVVYEGDIFDVDEGTANTIVHRPQFGNRGKEIVAAYAIAKLANGESIFRVMDREDLEAVRKAGSDSPAWRDWPDQMMLKAPIHRLGKFLQFDESWHIANALDNARTVDDQRRIIDVETSGESQRADLSSAIAAEMAAQATGGAPDPDEAAEIARLEREAAK